MVGDPFYCQVVPLQYEHVNNNSVSQQLVCHIYVPVVLRFYRCCAVRSDVQTEVVTRQISEAGSCGRR